MVIKKNEYGICTTTIMSNTLTTKEQDCARALLQLQQAPAQRLRAFHKLISEGYLRGKEVPDRSHLFALAPTPEKGVPDGVGTAPRGLVATAPIPAGTVITHYPAHTAVQDSAADPRSFILVPPFSGGDAVHYSILLSEPLGPLTHVVGDPAKADDPRWLAHMANDSCGNPFKKARTGEERFRAALTYFIVSSKRANAVIDTRTNPIPLVAARDIAAGEEILVSYGANYWLPADCPRRDKIIEDSIAWAQNNCRNLCGRAIATARAELPRVQKAIDHPL